MREHYKNKSQHSLVNKTFFPDIFYKQFQYIKRQNTHTLKKIDAFILKIYYKLYKHLESPMNNIAYKIELITSYRSRLLRIKVYLM